MQASILALVSYLPKLCCMNRTDRVIMDVLLAKHDVLMSNDSSSSSSSSSKPYPFLNLGLKKLFWKVFLVKCGSDLILLLSELGYNTCEG